MILRCLSYNIWKNEGDYPRRMAAIGALIAAHRPDVVALQECFVAPALGLDSAGTLAGADYHLARYPARAKPRWHEGAWVDSRSDMAILSLMPPFASGSLALPSDLRDGERGLLWVDLPLAGGIRLGCTHLTHLRDAAAQAVRGHQAAALMADDRLVILMGDCNAASDDPALAPIFEHSALCPAARAMAKTPTGQAPDNGAIDHVLLFARQTGARQTGARMINRRIIAAPDPSGFPSDHPAILAEIEFP